MVSRLLPLRIPTGWTVRWNGLFEEDDLPSEDLLWLAQVDAHGAPTGVFVDLGWYGSGDAGHYRLSALDGDWDHELARHTTRDRAEVVAVLERWLGSGWGVDG